MRRTDIPVFSGRLELNDAPINPAWILEGSPRARNRMLWNSGDKTGFCMMWDCTAGQFNWTYAFDELVHVVDGGVTVTGPDGIAKTLGPGDVALFPQGITVHWHVERYIRKVAYCQHQLPGLVALPLRVLRKLKALFVRPAIVVEKSAGATGNHVHA
jgi:uncharacterized cupin superfamily protein